MEIAHLILLPVLGVLLFGAWSRAEDAIKEQGTMRTDIELLKLKMDMTNSTMGTLMTNTRRIEDKLDNINLYTQETK